jgi:hypothetical protein
MNPMSLYLILALLRTERTTSSYTKELGPGKLDSVLEFINILWSMD